MSIRFLLLIALLLIPLSSQAETKLASWNLPVELTDKNTTVKFEVDSTWHMVHGTTAHISGNAKLLKPEDPSSVNVNLSIL